MARYHFVVLSNPVPGCAEDYNRWYDDQHLDDVLKVPGFVSARRFVTAPSQTPREGVPAWDYLALYEIETDDLAATLADLQARSGGPLMPISEAIDMEGCFATVYAERN